MFCMNCGTKIEEGLRFCPSCGKDASGATTAPVAPTAQQPVVSQAQTPMADEKYCFSCGSVIKKAAAICPRCGVNQGMRGSTTAVNVYCSSCGKTINKDAVNCPFCGVSQGASASGTTDKKGQAIASLVLGICGTIAWLLPVLGIPVTVLGVIMGIVGQKSSKKGMALAGIILSVVGFILSIINSAIGAYQGATYW